LKVTGRRGEVISFPGCDSATNVIVRWNSHGARPWGRVNRTSYFVSIGLIVNDVFPMMDSPIPSRPVAAPFQPAGIRRVQGEQEERCGDLLAVEEPLEIRVSYVKQNRRRQRTISVTMRTPGHDRELAVGFLLTEGILRAPRDVLAISDCRNGNRIRVHLRDDVPIDLGRLRRNFYVSSSCGVCGKTALDAVETCVIHPLPLPGPVLSRKLIHTLPGKLRAVQAVFEQTGGLHASALFNWSGELLCLREDVGRHNALDKLIGRQMLTRQFPLSETILLVSGRVSFELVQKSVMSGIPVLAAVGAPSSLAVALADRHGQTLLGFVRDGRFNVYSGAERFAENSET